jgi:predicted GNAT family N-acyltransferase
MLTHTFIHVTAWHNGRLVGFARAITDTVYRAVVDDVVVDAALRGRGVGTQLMKTIGVELSDVEMVILSCVPGVIPFYETVGYKRFRGPIMERP